MDRSSGSSGVQPGFINVQPTEQVRNDSPVKVVEGQSTEGLKTAHSLSENTALSDRSVRGAEPTSYLNRLYSMLESTTAFKVSKAFISDFLATSAGTLSEMAANVDKGVTEAARFTAGLTGLGAAFVQAAAALNTNDGEQVSLDMITPLLKQAGIDATGLSKSDIIQLSGAVAALQLGVSRDVEIKDGQFSIKYPDYSVKVSDIHLKNIGTLPVESAANTDSEAYTLVADELRFSLELDLGAGKPTQIDVRIPGLSLSGESNLLGLVGQAVSNAALNVLASELDPIAHYLSSSNHHATEAAPDDTSNSIQDDATDWKGWLNSWVDKESTRVSINAEQIVLNVNQVGSVLESYGIEDGMELTFSDIHATQSSPLIKEGEAGRIDLNMGLMEMDRIKAGPLELKSGFLRLDDDLNGELVVTLRADYQELKQYCPDWLPKKLVKSVTGVDNEKQIAAVRLGIKVSEGVVDLNSLKTSGLQEGRLTTLQKVIQERLLQTLRSEHTRLRKYNEGSELKIHVPIMGKNQKSLSRERVPEGINEVKNQNKSSALMDKLVKKSKKVKQKIAENLPVKPVRLSYKNYIPLSEQEGVFLPEERGRGKISLVQLVDQALDMSLEKHAPPGKK